MNTDKLTEILMEIPRWDITGALVNHEKIETAHSAIIKLFEEQVPVICVHDDGTPRTEFTDGWNECRSQILSNLTKLKNGEEG